MDELTDERKRAIESCSCPREAGETLLAPKCAALQYFPDTLFVDGAQYSCKHLIGFGNGHLCSCANRKKLYITYKL